MGEKPTEQDEDAERAVVKSKSNISNNREEEPAASPDDPAARSAGAPLKGVDIKLG